jgi:hypothetical protein
MANDVRMNTPGVTGKATIEMFSKVASATDSKHYHPFGCPVYVLAARQQADGKGEKWFERARVGINIGMSPVHSRNVVLVLSIKTGHASPQFHIKHDDLFETVKSLNVNVMWHKRTGFASVILGDRDLTLQPPVDPINLPPVASKPANGATEANESAPSVKPEYHHDNSVSKGASPKPMFDLLSIAPDSIFDIGTPADQGGSNQDISSSVRDRSFQPEHSRPSVRLTSGPTAEPVGTPSLSRTRTRIIRPPGRYNNLVSFIAQAWDTLWDIKDVEIQEALSDPIAFAASSDPDTMYLHEAL